jgi:serine/threonine protein kinase
MESFSKELQVLKRAQHHHIVQLVGSYTDPKFVGLLFSPVADMNLAEFYSLVSKSSPDKSLLRTVFGCLSNGLSYLHSVKIRHKDIKPGNILVMGKTVLFTDFNVSYDGSDTEHSVTNDSMPLMTLKYSTPEMLNDGPRGSSLASGHWAAYISK